MTNKIITWIENTKLYKKLDTYFSKNEVDELKVIDIRYNHCNEELGNTKRLLNNCRVEIEEFRTAYNEMSDKYAALKLGVQKPFRFRKYMANATMRAKLMDEGFRGVDIHLSDSTYGLISAKALDEFLNADDTDLKQWIKDQHDCDDFSAQLYTRMRNHFGNVAFGIVWITEPMLHAINIVVLENGVVRMIEPQTDLVYKLPDNYKTQLIFM